MRLIHRLIQLGMDNSLVYVVLTIYITYVREFILSYITCYDYKLLPYIPQTIVCVVKSTVRSTYIVPARCQN